MDDKEEKTVIEKLVDTVKNVASNIATTASNAAQYAMETDAKKMDPNIEAVAEKPNEQMPTAAVIAPKKRAASQKAERTKPFPNLSGRITPAYDIPIPASPMGTTTVTIGKKKTKTASKKPAPKVARKTGKMSNKKSIAKKSKKPKKSALKPGRTKTTSKAAKKRNRSDNAAPNKR